MHDEEFVRHDDAFGEKPNLTTRGPQESLAQQVGIIFQRTKVIQNGDSLLFFIEKEDMEDKIVEFRLER